MAKVRLLLANDYMLVAEAFKKLLETEFEVVGVASDGRKLLQLAQQTKPDVALLDLGMPELNGFDAGLQLKKLLPATKIIVVTMNEDGDMAKAALNEWASGYLLKTSARTELPRAIYAVIGGQQYLTPRIACQQSERFIRVPSMSVRPLTYRQRQVLQLLAEGRSMKQAAAELQIAARTIAFHKYRIMALYGLKNYPELVRFAIKQKVTSAT